MINIRRTLGACFCAVICIAAMGCSSSSSSHQVHFPHELPVSLTVPNIPTNVSSGKAFRDNHISIPSDAADLRYAADEDQYGWLVDVAFTMPCKGVPGFVRANSLSQEYGVQAQFDLSGDNAARLGEKLGWKYPDPLARAYKVDNDYGTHEVVITGSSECQVYFFLGFY